ncbi:hypothetical protein [Streptomyces sp. CA2R101]|uniref:hypothetical protein n=1 Tax=Streptomyces sp. CA2R101 TaxID=3120152 RepID=UPI00300A3847
MWWYDLEIELPDRVDDRRHGPALTSRKIAFCAPHPVVQPIEGEVYSSLDLPPPEHRKCWRLAPPPQGDGWADVYLHRLDCAQAAAEGGLATGQEALEALAGPDVGRHRAVPGVPSRHRPAAPTLIREPARPVKLYRDAGPAAPPRGRYERPLNRRK